MNELASHFNIREDHRTWEAKMSIQIEQKNLVGWLNAV
jgi:hypothetical protein